jgi:L-lactate utilization protein LutC
MNSREVILGKLRKVSVSIPSITLEPVVSREIFSDYPQGQGKEMLPQFSQRLVPLKGEVHSAADCAEAGRILANLCRESGITTCIRQADPLVDRVFRDAGLEAIFSVCVCPTDVAPANLELERIQLSVTPADALISRTGSVVLRATRGGGRRLSVLPEVHCVIATESQLVPSLDAWIGSIRSDKDWSFGTIITGPSRTADIEKILVLGAHGPRRLIVIVIAGGPESAV